MSFLQALNQKSTYLINICSLVSLYCIDMINMTKDARSFELTHPGCHHCNLLQLSLQIIALHLLPHQLNVLASNLHTLLHKLPLRDAGQLVQLLNSKVHKISGKYPEGIANSSVNYSLPKFIVRAEISDVQSGLVPQIGKVLPLPKLSNLEQNLCIFDFVLVWNFVTLNEEGEIEVLSVDDERVGVFFDNVIDSFDPNGKGIDLQFPEEFDELACIFSIEDEVILFIDECLVILASVVVFLLHLSCNYKIFDIIHTYRELFMQMAPKISTLLILSLITILTVQRWTIPDIKDAVAKDMGCVELRSESSIQLYAELRKKIASQGITLPTYIENQKFGYDGQAAAPIYQLFNITWGDQEFAVYILTDEPEELGWIKYPLEEEYSISGLSKQINFLLFTVNDFPYELVEGIEHWLVWSNREIQLGFVNTIIDEALSKQFEHFAFVNPPAKKSIPQIYHAQVFIQKRTEVSQQL